MLNATTSPQRRTAVPTGCWLVRLALWGVALAAGWMFAPSWGAVAQVGEVSALPSNSPSIKADRLYHKAFPLEYSGSSIVLVFYREEGELQEQDEKFVESI